MQKFDTPAPVTAVLDIPAGRVRFIAADRADTAVEVLPANASKSRDVKAAEQTEVGYGDGVLRIKAPEAKNQILGPSGSIEVTVQLPAGSRIEAWKTALVEFRGVGRLGDVSFEGAQGSVKLDEAAGARLTLQSGDISVGRLGGPAHISAQKGDLRITEAVRGAGHAAHRVRRDLGRRRPRSLRLPGRRHLLRPDPQRAQEHRRRRRHPDHPRDHRPTGDISARSL
ncbi:hypothetical protein SALBM311S_12197 [Streptomyces alboniger]